MVQQGTILNICDNSGARYVKCIKVLGGSHSRYARIGDKIVVSVKELRSKRKSTAKVKKGAVLHALVIHTKQIFFQNAGRTAKFKLNTAVLLNNQNKPIGSRIIAGVPLKIRFSKFMRLATLSLGLVK